MLYNAIFTTYNGAIKTINGIEAKTKEKATEIALKIAKISFQPLQFQSCNECKGKE